MRSDYNVVDTDGLTASDIGKDQPHIIVVKPRPTPSPKEEEGGENEAVKESGENNEDATEYTYSERKEDNE